MHTDDMTRTICDMSNDGLSERAIAERLGVSQHKVKTALNRPTQRIAARPKTWDEAVAAVHGEASTHTPAIIEGVTAEQTTSVENIWTFVQEAQQIVFEKQQRRGNQSIKLPDEPVAIAFLSDLHIGSAGTDYTAIREDAEMIQHTPGLYAGFHGDGTDNWIVGKLTSLQRGQAVGFDAERLLFESWVSMVADKLLWWVGGNHDQWSEKLIGSSPDRALIKDKLILWDRNQCAVKIKHCGIERTALIRHKWRFNSVFNASHGLQVGWERGDVDYTWAIGGHTHIGTYCHPFHRHNKRRYAILTGAYKKVDGFGEEIGFASPKDNGCGAMVLNVDGSQVFFDTLAPAVDYLAYLRR